MSSAEIRAALLRLVLGVVLALGFALLAGPMLTRLSMPMLERAYTMLDRNHRVLELRLADRTVLGAQDHVIRLVIAPAYRSVFVGNRLAQTNPDGRAAVSVLSAWLWQPLCIALPLLCAWPARQRREWLLRSAMLPPLAAAFTLLDLPLVLLAEVWQLYIDAWNPGYRPPLVIWASFLQGGGRLMLGVLLAAACVGAGRLLACKQAVPSGRGTTAQGACP